MIFDQVQQNIWWNLNSKIALLNITFSSYNQENLRTAVKYSCYNLWFLYILEIFTGYNNNNDIIYYANTINIGHYMNDLPYFDTFVYYIVFICYSFIYL